MPPEILRVRNWRLRIAPAVAAAFLTVLPPYRLTAQSPVPAAGAARSPAAIEVSANPVTQASVTLHWPAVPGTARVDVFSLTGAHVRAKALADDPGRWVWDLTGDAGQPVANGMYYIVVTLGDNTRLRRRLLVAR